MSKVLMVHDGKRERELLLVERLVVGRDPACDISVDDGLLSRRHAEFIAAASAVTVRDLGSRNGTFVNGIRRAEQALKPGDVVQIGPLRVRYLRDRIASPGASSPADRDGTGPIPPTAPRGETVPSPPSAIDVFRPAPVNQALEALDAGARQTHAGSGGFAEGTSAEVDAAEDATSFTPTPRPAPIPVGLTSIAVESSVAAAPSAETPAPTPGLRSFVVIQLGVLAIFVFVATAAPLVLSRGTVLSALDEGRVTALLIWPILPLVIGLVATLVTANIVNGRVVEALAARRQNVEDR